MAKSGCQMVGIAIVILLDVSDHKSTGARRLIDGDLLAAMREAAFLPSGLIKEASFVSTEPGDCPMYGRTVEAVCLVH